MTQTVQRSGEDDYGVRWSRGDDRDGILTLYEAEWGRRPSCEWFDWKYVDDPYLSHVPVTVAKRGGEVVGAQAYVPFPVRRGDRTALALQPADAVVHRDHRRNGLYTRMTRAAIDRYESGEPAFFFNFPNPGALAAQEEMGWSAVDRVGTSYRVQDPAMLADGTSALTALVDAVGAVSRSVLDLRSRSVSAPEGLTVARHEKPPAETLAALYDRARSDGFHVRRDAEFYDWWLGDPSFDHRAYVARRHGRPVAALVTRTREGRKEKLLDALPMAADRPAALRALLAVWTDDSDAAVLSVAESTLPGGRLLSFGFVPDDAPVVSRVCTRTNLAARPLAPDGEDSPFRRAELADAANWQITFAEQDRF